MSALVQETWAQLRRWLYRLRREPFNLAFALLQPLLFFVFFGGAFENMVRGAEPAGYRSFLLAGVLALTVFGNSMTGGIPILFDRENGFLGRCLAAPISRLSVFLARFAAVNLISALQILIFLGVAALFGVRVASGIAGVGLLILFGWLLGLGVTTVSLWLAFRLRGHGDFFAVLGTATLPVAFLSTAFVRLESMPAWMGVLARLNPLSYAVDAMRPLVLERALDLAGLARMGLALLVFDALTLWLGTRALRRAVG